MNPYDKPRSLLDLNPRGLVPTLSYQNQALYESNVICEFLDEAYPDHGAALLPKDPYEKARCRIWMDFVTTRIIPAFHRFLQWQPSESAPTIDGKREEFLNTLREFTGAMAEEGPWFGGKEIGMVDLVLAPWAVRLWVLDHFKEGGVGVPEEGGERDGKVWKRWREWRGAVEARKSVRETGSEREMYLPIYEP